MCVDGDVVDAVDVGGLRIAFQREGRGPPLMLLHGFVGDGVGTWGYQLEALSDAFTVIAWDCPGAGHSSAVPESFRLADYGWAGPRRAGTRRDSPHMWRGCRSALSWR